MFSSLYQQLFEPFCVVNEHKIEHYFIAEARKKEANRITTK